YLYQGYKPVNWCLDCQSALAEAEVEYEDKTSSAIDVAFEVVDRSDFWSKVDNSKPSINKYNPNMSKPVCFVIWTTTPWTLPANQAVCLNPQFQYDVIEMSDQYLVLASQLRDQALTRYGVDPLIDDRINIVAGCLGEKLANILLLHPFYERNVPVVLGHHVTAEAGTGAVHTAPAHGVDDYVVGQEYGLPTGNPVGDDGKFISTTPDVGGVPLAGVFVWKANDIVLQALEASGHLLHQEKLKHSYPHCWRHKTPIIFRSTPQWFIWMTQNSLPSPFGRGAEGEGASVENALPHPNPPPMGEGMSLRSLANKAVDDTQFFPSWGRARLEAMIKNRPDWCVSRQRNWGVPMPFFVHKETGELHPNTPALLEQVALLVEQSGIEAWFSLDAVTLLGSDAGQYKKLTHTLDVWFDSGVTHASVLQRREELRSGSELYLADLYLEGSDQHRGWFQSSLLTGCAINGRAPFNALLTHGFVVDGSGHKMSKSKGNVIAPQKIFDTLGADILRLWTASTDYSGELTISDEILKRVVESYRRIRNTLRFLLANIADFDATRDAMPVEQWLEIDRYALSLTQKLQDELSHPKNGCYAKYEFHTAVQKLQSFCSEDLGSFYLDILKDRLYTAGGNSKVRRSAQNALYHITHALTRLIAPILSFTGEEVWEVLAGRDDVSVFEQLWYELPPQDSRDEVESGFDSISIPTNWSIIREWRNRVNKHLEDARSTGVIGSALQAEVDLYVSDDPKTSLSDFNLLDSLRDDLRLILITSRASVHRVATEAEQRIEVTPSTHTKCDRCWHYRADVGSDAAHPTICGRCVSNLFGQGEARHYA
ncbi:MAG: isoleucine--tRNA ligase, partial [Gallionella sp.]